MKKLTALLLAVFVIAGLLGGCNNTPATSATPTPKATPTGSAASPTPDETDDPMRLPIVDEKITFSAITWFRSVVIADWNENEAFKELEKRTNVHIDFAGWNADRTEKFNLMVNSGDYYDLLNFFTMDYVGGFDSYVDNDVIIDLKDYIPELAPRYMAIREQYPDVKRDTVTDTGVMPAFFLISDVPQPSWYGPTIRGDMASAAGIDPAAIVTYDDYHAALVKLKDSGLPDYALGLGTEAGVCGWLLSGFGLHGYGITNGFANVNGKVVHGPSAPAFKDYIEMLREWYDEGLVDEYFYTRGSTGDGGTINDTNIIYNDTFGLIACSYTRFDLWESQAREANPDFTLTPIKVPVQNASDKRMIYYTGTSFRTVNKTMAISTNCKEPEIAVRYLDYCYDREMATILMFGNEGSGKVTIDGEPFFSDKQLESADGLNGNEYSVLAMWPTIYMWTREITTKSSEKVATSIWETWNNINPDNNYQMPAVSLTTEESTKFANIMSEVNTYIVENAVRFIVGDKSMSDWDAYIAQLKSMGIDDAVAIQQAALTRYIARG